MTSENEQFRNVAYAYKRPYFSLRQISKYMYNQALEPCAAAAAADNLWAPPPTFVDRRAAADNLSARRRYHCCSVVIFGIFDDFFKFSALLQVQTSNGFMFLDVELL